MTNHTDAQAKTIIFLHIQKTAGTTLHQIIDRQYQPDQIYSFDAEHDLEHFTSLSGACRAGFRMIRGHMIFGMHKLVPRPCTYFTMLRDPIERVISYFHYVRRIPAHYHYDLVHEQDMGLRAYLESGEEPLVDNAQVRMLSGPLHTAGYGQCTQEMLEVAKQNLRESFSVVGLAERFDETLLLLKRTYRWQNIYYTWQNVAHNRPQQEALSPATLDVLMQVTELDYELYRYAETLLDQQIRRYRPFFALQLRSFRRLNRTFSPLYEPGEIEKPSIPALARHWAPRGHRP